MNILLEFGKNFNRENHLYIEGFDMRRRDIWTFLSVFIIFSTAVILPNVQGKPIIDKLQKIEEEKNIITKNIQNIAGPPSPLGLIDLIIALIKLIISIINEIINIILKIFNIIALIEYLLERIAYLIQLIADLIQTIIELSVP